MSYLCTVKMFWFFWPNPMFVDNCAFDGLTQQRGKKMPSCDNGSGIKRSSGTDAIAVSKSDCWDPLVAPMVQWMESRSPADHRWDRHSRQVLIHVILFQENPSVFQENPFFMNIWLNSPRLPSHLKSFEKLWLSGMFSCLCPVANNAAWICMVD